MTIVNFIIRALLKHKKLTVNGDGSNVRDYIHIDDASMLLASLVTNSQSEKVSIFNVSSGKGYSVNRIINLLEHQTSSKLSICNAPAKSEKKSVIGNNSKILTGLQLTPNYNLRKGLFQTLKKYKDEKTF